MTFNDQIFHECGTVVDSDIRVRRRELSKLQREIGTGTRPMARVELAITPMIMFLGVRAYHSSVLLDGREIWFSDVGIAVSRTHNLVSHSRCRQDLTKIIHYGATSRSEQDLVKTLGPFFRKGTYDMLVKNCNSFSDCLLWYLVGKRLDPSYNLLDRLGASWPWAASSLMPGSYYANPRSASFDVETVIEHLSPDSSNPCPTNRSAGGSSKYSFAGGYLSMCVDCAQPESSSRQEVIADPYPLLLRKQRVEKGSDGASSNPSSAPELNGMAAAHSCRSSGLPKRGRSSLDCLSEVELAL